MDRNQYLEIRKTTDLSIKKSSLASHYFRESFFVVAVAYFASQNSSLKFLAIPILSALIFRNFSLMHEAVHKAVSKKVWLNDGVGLLAGGLCLLPFEQWRRSHLDHHTWSGNIDKDPVTALVKLFPKFTPKVQSTLNFFWKGWFPLIALVQYTVFWGLAAQITMNQKRSLKLVLSNLSPIFVWGTIAFFTPSSFMLQIVLPSVLLYLVAVEVINFPHHLQLPQNEGEVRLAFWEQYKVTRSCSYPKWFSRWVVLNFNLHTEHHLFPDVPWYRLESLQPKIISVINESYNSDPQFRWIRENKRIDLGVVLRYKDTAPKAHEINKAA